MRVCQTGRVSMVKWFSAIIAVLQICAGGSLLAQTLSYTDILKRAPVKADVRIAYGSDPLQFGDLWLPQGNEKAASPFPVIVLLHGGCWLADLPGVELTHFMADDLRKNGFAVWELEYRRVGHKGGGYPGTFLDVANGTDFLRGIAKKYNLNLKQVIASGHSAGGHLALWLAARSRLPANSPINLPSPLPIHRVVGVAAISDLAFYAKAGAHACGDDTVARLLDVEKRGKADPTAPFKDTSPPQLFPIGVKQILVYGVYDGIVPPSMGLRHKNQATAKGETVEIISVANAGHFELISPWTEPWQEVLAVFRRALN
ncbi:MAG: alpha/beta hydrolase [Betaproteobacteria bacterium]